MEVLIFFGALMIVGHIILGAVGCIAALFKMGKYIFIIGAILYILGLLR